MFIISKYLAINIYVLTVLLLAFYVPVTHAENKGEVNWQDYISYAKKLDPLPPTPIGEGNMGSLPSGQYVKIKFPVPLGKVLSYSIYLGNIVAYRGNGEMYQVVIKIDDIDGKVVHQSSKIGNSESFNTHTREIIDISKYVTEKHRNAGCLELFVTVNTLKDTWTLYKHSKDKPINVLFLTYTNELEREVKINTMLSRHGVELLPKPKELTLAQNGFEVRNGLEITYSAGLLEDTELVTQGLSEDLRERIGILTKTVKGADPMRYQWISLKIPSGIKGNTVIPADIETLIPSHTQGYYLSVTPEDVVIAGKTAQGLFYGCQALLQLMDTGKKNQYCIIPCIKIRDWPLFDNRMVQYDFARGQSVNIGYIKRMIRQMAFFKINQLMVYMEDDFKFEKYPFLGDKGSFEPKVVKELSEYAKKYFVELIPQFESLGHARNVLSHAELKDLRENGNPNNFCVLNENTFVFLDNVYNELSKAFVNTGYIHIGGDEYESGFCKCVKCKEFAKKFASEYEAKLVLYSWYINSLGKVLKKYNKRMLYWVSHSIEGDRIDQRTGMTLSAAKQLDKEFIPFEWIYHGPSSYPSLDDYKTAGWNELYAVPAVVGYSRVYPDYETTFRGIRGFYEEAYLRGYKNGCVATWELVRCGLFENQWLGIVYSAECSWSGSKGGLQYYFERYKKQWFGIDENNSKFNSKVDNIIYRGALDTLNTGNYATYENVTIAFFTGLEEFYKKYVRPDEKSAGTAAVALAKDCVNVKKVLKQMKSVSTSNQLSINALELMTDIRSAVAEKTVALLVITKAYTGAYANRVSPGTVKSKLMLCKNKLGLLLRSIEVIKRQYRYFCDNAGAALADIGLIENMAEDTREKIVLIDSYLQECDNGRIPSMQNPYEFISACKGVYPIGYWDGKLVRMNKDILEFEITRIIKDNGEYLIEFSYTSGKYGLDIENVTLLENGKIIAEDSHSGFTGNKNKSNVYKVTIKDYDKTNLYRIVVRCKTAGGDDTSGELVLVHL
ncbi:MAG: beta-N-acetylhexosaminidase [Elusimicrobiota bacterium]